MFGVVINPGSDNFKIPVWLVFHIIEDINENNRIYNRHFLSKNLSDDNNILHNYCKGKKNF